MTTTRRNQLLFLVMLLVVGGAVVVIGPFGGLSTQAPGVSPNRPGRGAAGSAASDPVTDVKLELLQQEHGPLRGPDRNPFRFESRPVAPAPAPTRRVTQVELPPAGPLPPPPPPPIPLRFIGYMQPSGTAGRVAVLSDGRGNVIDGREGDIIEGRYRLLRVGNDSADLIYLDGRGRQTIRLSGQ